MVDIINCTIASGNCLDKARITFVYTIKNTYIVKRICTPRKYEAFFN